jgi:hypothetical protein
MVHRRGSLGTVDAAGNDDDDDDVYFKIISCCLHIFHKFITVVISLLSRFHHLTFIQTKKDQNSLKRDVLQNLWSEHTSNADQQKRQSIAVRRRL